MGQIPRFIERISSLFNVFKRFFNFYHAFTFFNVFFIFLQSFFTSVDLLCAKIRITISVRSCFVHDEETVI